MKKFSLAFKAKFLWGVFFIVIVLCNSLWGQLAPTSNWAKVISDSRPATGTWEDHNPEIECVGSTVHFLWFSIKNDFSRGILYYRNSTDGGKTLNSFVVVKDTTGDINPFSGLTKTSLKRMAINGNNIHVAYKYRDEIYYSRSTNNGVSFSKPKIIFALGGIANYDFSNPYISCNGNTVVVGYTESWGEPFLGAHWYDAVSVAVSSDNGTTFKNKRIGKFKEWTWSNLVDVIQTSTRIHALVSFTNNDVTNVGVATSSDGGTTFKTNWLTDTLNTKANSLLCGYENSYEPKIAVTGKNIYVVWGAKDKDGIARLYLCRSTNEGNTFELPHALIESSDPKYGSIYRASITVAAKNEYIYIAYAKETSDFRKAFILKSTNSGLNFSSPIELISDAHIFQYYQVESVNPTIEFSPADQTGKDVYVAMNRLKYRHSTDGFTILGPLKIVDLYFNNAFRQRNKLAVDQNGTAHFVYEYQIGLGNYEDRRIYYRNVPLTPESPVTTNMALALDASSTDGRWDNMQVPASADLNFSDAMTAELWIKPTVGSNKSKAILFREAYTSDGINQRDGTGIRTEDSNGRQPYALLTTTKDEYASRIYSNTRIGEGVWSHIAMTYDANAGSKNFKLYVNGKLEASSTVTGNLSPNHLDGPLWLGGSVWGESEAFRGEVDELRLWKRALTIEEIAANMNKQLNGNENGLVAYYNFNNTVKDISGRGNDGILMYKESFVPGNPVGIKNESNIPSTFSLSQNFPNPFNPETIINYQLSASSHVILKVYDLLGREVATLVNKEQPAGSYSARLSTNIYQLSSGTYFYKLTAGNYSSTRKMILMK